MSFNARDFGRVLWAEQGVIWSFSQARILGRTEKLRGPTGDSGQASSVDGIINIECTHFRGPGRSWRTSCAAKPHGHTVHTPAYGRPVSAQHTSARAPHAPHALCAPLSFSKRCVLHSESLSRRWNSRAPCLGGSVPVLQVAPHTHYI
eukprot:352474-Chlamydomonas_euryale.AAC.5